MTLTTLNKTFWDYFKQCPRRSCLNFRKNHSMFNVKLKTYKKLTIDQQKFLILEEISKNFFTSLITNRQTDIVEIQKNMLALLQLKKRKIETNTKYNDTYKKEFNKMIINMKQFIELEKLLKILNPNDALDLKLGAEYEMNITEYINKNLSENHINSIKNEFHYKLDIPFYKEEADGITVIKFTNDSYLYELNNDLIITKAFFEKSTEEKLNKMIIYDLNKYSRIELLNKDINFTHLFKIMKIIDSEYIYANPNPYCEECDYKELCVTGVKKTFKEILLDEKNKKKI